MPGSTRFRALQSRIRQLRKHFLPKNFHPTGTYSERQIDRVRAFRLLAHAEIESYLEEIVVDTANSAFEAWQQRRLVTEPLMALIAYSDYRADQVPQKLPLTGPRDLDSRIENCKNRFNTYVKTMNHGIREENALNMLLPVGISEYDIDSTWLSTTNSFGRERGETAHRSNQVSNPPDPKNEYDIVTQVVEGLSPIDERLLRLQSPQQ